MRNPIGIKLIALAADAAFFRLSLSPTGEMFFFLQTTCISQNIEPQKERKNFTYFFKSILLLFSDVILYKINIL